MKKITIFNDIHLYGPHSLKVNWEYGPDVYCLGDVVDLSHCRKQDVQYALSTLYYLQSIFLERYILGNHELDAIAGPNYLKVGDTLLTHGDFLFWTKKYAKKYRSRPKGVGALRRWFSLSGIDPLRHLLPEIGLCKGTLKKIVLMAKLQRCKMIVCAHRHPNKILRYEYRGVKILVLPPGKNVIEIMA